MKKSICLFLALCILLSFCACGKTESADTLAEAEPEMIESWISETIPAPTYADGWNGMTEEFSLWDGKLFLPPLWTESRVLSTMIQAVANGTEYTTTQQISENYQLCGLSP